MSNLFTSPISAMLFGMDSLSFFMTLILLIDVLVGTHKRSPKNKTYAFMLLSVMPALVADAITWLNIQWTDCLPLFYFLITVTFSLPFATVAFFFRYLYQHANEKNLPISPVLFRIGTAGSFAFAILITVACLSGMLFTVDGGVYAPTEYFIFHFIFYLTVVIYAVIAISLHIRVVGRHDALSAFAFLIVPFFTLFLDIFIPELEVSVPALSIECLIIHTLLLSETETTLSHQINHDELTELNNRRAFNNLVDSLPPDCDVNVVFCDINGLKEQNDTFGHLAGDALLQKFAFILKKHFPDSTIFRISGDEFTLIVRNEAQETFDAHLAGLYGEIELCDSIASVGHASGKGKDIVELLNDAENKMYENKKNYYERTGKKRRTH